MSQVAELNLVKGQKVDLTKTNPSTTVFHVGLGWDPSGSNDSFDLDAFALELKTGKLANVVYFNAKQSAGIEHMGDNLTGTGDNDDETIKLTLASVSPDVTEIMIGVNIYQAASKRQNFGMVQNAFIRVYDGVTGSEILKFDLSEDYSAFNGVIFGKIYRREGEWKFQAEGVGKNGDITEISNTYR